VGCLSFYLFVYNRLNEMIIGEVLNRFSFVRSTMDEENILIALLMENGY